MIEVTAEVFLTLLKSPSPEIMLEFMVLQALLSTMMTNPYPCQPSGLGSSSTFTLKALKSTFNTSLSPIFSSLVQNVLNVLATLMLIMIVALLYVLRKPFLHKKGFAFPVEKVGHGTEKVVKLTVLQDNIQIKMENACFFSRFPNRVTRICPIMKKEVPTRRIFRACLSYKIPNGIINGKANNGGRAYSKLNFTTST